MNTLLSCSNHNHLSDAKLKYGTSISQVAQPIHGDEQKEWELKVGMQTPSTNTSKVCNNPELLDSADQNLVAQKKKKKTSWWVETSCQTLEALPRCRQCRGLPRRRPRRQPSGGWRSWPRHAQRARWWTVRRVGTASQAGEDSCPCVAHELQSLGVWG